MINLSRPAARGRRSRAAGVEFTAREAATVAEEAFVFGFPLVLMDRLRGAMTSVDEPDPDTLRAPPNTLVHARGPAWRAAGIEDTPNADALPTSAWLDLSQGPVVLSVPETCGRYYVLSMLDMWTGMFASVGARSTGTGPGTFVISGPGRHGGLVPPGHQPISAPTGDVRIIGETAVERGPRFGAAHAVQDAFRLAPLHGGGGAVPARVETSDDNALETVMSLGAEEFFSRLTALMSRNPPRPEDRPVVARIERLDLADAAAHRGSLSAAIERGVTHGRAIVAAEARLPRGEAAGRWLVHHGLGRYGTDYLRRAGAAAAGLGTTSAADELVAVLTTDSRGRALDGDHRYLLRFEPDDLPPAHGSWALSTCDEQRLLVGDRVDRSSIGDHYGLKLEHDGALILVIQAEPPDRARLSNWLAAPEGPFSLVLRLFWPSAEAVEGRWSPPAAARID